MRLRDYPARGKEEPSYATLLKWDHPYCMRLRDYPARGKEEPITRLAQMGSSILHAQRGKTQKRSSTRNNQNPTVLRFCVSHRYYSYFHSNSTVCGDARARVLPSSRIPFQYNFGISSVSYLSWMIGQRTARIDALFAQKSYQKGKWQ